MFLQVPYKTLQVVVPGYRYKLFLQVVVLVLVPGYPVPVIVVPGYPGTGVFMQVPRYPGTFRDFKSKFDNW